MGNRFLSDKIQNQMTGLCFWQPTVSSHKQASICIIGLKSNNIYFVSKDLNSLYVMF